MLVEERRQRVLNLVSSRGFVALDDLARDLGASHSTIRRDLDFWHKHGSVRRTHGGAIYVGDATVLPALEERSASQLEEKRAVARAAADRIRAGETVLLDGGTTTLEVARLLVGRSVQVVTNSLPIASLFASSRDTDLVMLGGYVYPKTGVALGPLTVRMLEDVHVHLTVLSVGGITARGFFNSNLLLVETERADAALCRRGGGGRRSHEGRSAGARLPVSLQGGGHAHCGSGPHGGAEGAIGQDGNAADPGG